MWSASFLPVGTMWALALLIELGTHKGQTLTTVGPNKDQGGPPQGQRKALTKVGPCVGPIQFAGLKLTWSIWL